MDVMDKNKSHTRISHEPLLLLVVYYIWVKVTTQKFFSLKNYLLIGFFFCLPYVRGQLPVDINTMKPNVLKGYAESAVRLGDEYSAIRYLERFISLRPEKNDIKYKLAHLYKKVRNYHDAALLFSQTYHSDQQKYIKALFYCGQMLKMSARYDSALTCFYTFKRHYVKGNDVRLFHYLTDHEITGCDAAMEETETDDDLNIFRLDSTINNPHMEQAPRYLNDTTIIFTSLKTDTLAYHSIHQRAGRPVRQLYVAQKKSEGWKLAGHFNGVFNIDSIDTGNGILSPDGERFYFTRCSENRHHDMNCKLYVSRLTNQEWEKPKKLGKNINIPNYTSTQPTIGNCYDKNLDVIYFVSDRPDGYGGLDIWYTIYNKRTRRHKKPVNAGSFINTPGNEITPFYHLPTKTLYFSSDTWPGYGGYDIFHTTGELAGWGSVKNLKQPVNSPVDELYYTLHDDQTEGFFTSNRPGSDFLFHESCCDDIYCFNHETPKELLLTGNIYDDTTDVIEQFLSEHSKPLEAKKPEIQTGKGGAIVSLYLVYGDNDNKLFLETDTTNKQGEYSFRVKPGNDYLVNVSDKRFIGKPLKISIGEPQEYDKITLEPIQVNEFAKKTYIVKNIYYPFDQAALTDSAKNTIDTTIYRILSEIPDIVVEISSHTDNRGEKDYNLKLSRQRAENVAKYLNEKGVAENRIVAKGYGESKPIAPNKNPDGTDNPGGRQRNRRTEFTIIGKIDQRGISIEEQ